MNKLLIKIGDFIVDMRYLFLVVFLILTGIGIANINNVNINYDITSYLPNGTETKVGLEKIQASFGDVNEIQLMIANIGSDEAGNLKEEFAKIEHVAEVNFENSDNYYKEENALFVIELDQVNNEERENVVNEIKRLTDDKEISMVVDGEDDVVNGMELILTLAVVVIVLVLIFTSQSYFDIILAFLVFSVSILLNMGSNFLLGDISYITKSIAIVLQLGLSLDYLIIFLNHYMKEVNDTDDLLLAVKKTVSKSIPEIFASSLTTIAGLMALVFMQLKIGGDIGIVMSKGILCSLLTVILLLPCLLILFHKFIMKWKHKSFIPDTTKLSKVIVNGRKVILPVFLILIVGSIFMATKYHYVYNIYSVESVAKSDREIASKKIKDHFGSSNQLVVLVKNEEKDYALEKQVASELLKNDSIIGVTNVGNILISENMYAGTALNVSEFAKTFQLDLQSVGMLYQAYAKDKGEIAKLQNMDQYRICLIDMITFMGKNISILPVAEPLKTKILTYHTVIQDKMPLVESDQYSRFIINFKGDVESDETFQLLDDIKEVVDQSYDEVYLVGESVSARDLKNTFAEDNIKISFITILFIAIILLCTFKSIGIAVLLILTIEGSIFLNFGLQTLFGQKIFFISYIIVSAIQMGATIDYAIVLTNRYQTLRKKRDKKDALVGSLKDSLPAIITSGLILTVAGFLIGFISDSGVVSSIGMSLGIGTVISLICTILVLPAILYASDSFIRFTSFHSKNKNIKK